MRQTGIRTYEVRKADFPITVVIRARKLAACDVVVSDVHVVKNGELIDQFTVTVTSDDANLAKRYAVKKPKQRPSCDLLQTVNGWFGAKPPDNASYEITMTSAQDDEFKTSIGVPSIDPGIANLTFQYR